MDSANKNDESSVEAVLPEDSPAEKSNQLGPEVRHIRRNFYSLNLSEGGSRELIHRWQQVAAWCVKHETDPWKDLDFENLPVRNCQRHRYSAEHQEWTVDVVQVKIHPEPFAEGAMRKCYRLKKLSSHFRNSDWNHAQNFIAKKYKTKIDGQIYFEDAKLQMDSKLWAEEFNRHNPPKKIDIFQVCVLEFLDGNDTDRFYHVERFIEGSYIKYNSNSGFVSNACRKTPQAFSHFTFERSGHQLIVVDIQGVDDLYTDPQIHTADGVGYGTGNFGTKGMALFFHSHICNDICRAMGLTEFDLAKSERIILETNKNLKRMANSSTKRSRNRPPSVCSSLVGDRDDAMEQLRRRAVSVNNLRRRSLGASSIFGGFSQFMQRSEPRLSLNDRMGRFVQPLDRFRVNTRNISSCSSNYLDSVDDVARGRMPRDYQFGSTSGCNSRGNRERENEGLWLGRQRESRPAGLPIGPPVKHACDYVQHFYHSASLILGQIHYDMAWYHQSGRFARNTGYAFCEKLHRSNAYEEMYPTYDHGAAFYHLNIARHCGLLEAIVTMAKIALGLPHELLDGVNCKKFWGNGDFESLGVDLMEHAAHMGDQFAIVFVAEACETGRFMRERSWSQAINWYKKALKLCNKSNEILYDGYPRYEILGRMANIYKRGGYGLFRDLPQAYSLYTEAASLASEVGRGRIAIKYYELAEQCLSA